MRAPPGFPEANWRAFVELGIPGLPFTEEEGGFGGGPVETMLVMEAVGRNLVVEPLLASVVLGSTALRLGGSAAQKARYIPGLVRAPCGSPWPIPSGNRATTCSTWPPPPGAAGTASC